MIIIKEKEIFGQSSYNFDIAHENSQKQHEEINKNNCKVYEVYELDNLDDLYKLNEVDRLYKLKQVYKGEFQVCSNENFYEKLSDFFKNQK